MLARKYDNYAWQEQPAEQYEVQQPARRKVHRPDPRRVLRNRILKAFLLIMAAYFIVVLRSNAMVQYGMSWPARQGYLRGKSGKACRNK